MIHTVAFTMMTVWNVHYATRNKLHQCIEWRWVTCTRKEKWPNANQELKAKLRKVHPNDTTLRRKPHTSVGNANGNSHSTQSGPTNMYLWRYCTTQTIELSMGNDGRRFHFLADEKMDTTMAIKEVRLFIQWPVQKFISPNLIHFTCGWHAVVTAGSRVGYQP